MPESSDRGAGDAGPRSFSVSGHRYWSRRGLVRVLVLLLCLLALFFAYQVARTSLAVYRVQRDVDTLSRQVGAQDVSGGRNTLHDISHQAKVAHDHSDNVLWALAGRVPWIGTDFHAIRVGSSALDQTARLALPQALHLFDSLTGGQLGTATGKFNTAAIARLEPSFVAMQAGVTPAAARIDAIDAKDLKLPPVRSVIREFQQSLGELVSFSRTGITASKVLPAMLGADGPRDYLLVAQTNAEIRATGGLPGSFSIVQVRDGKIELGRQLTKYDFPTLSQPVIPLTKDERAMYGDQLGTDVRDTNVTPDLPRAAQMVNAMYERRFGRPLDGVIFIDPFVLSAVLKVTGPVAVGSETVDSDDIARKLLNTVYLRYPEPDRQDAYFSTTARRIFYVVTRRKIKQVHMLQAIGKMVGQRRFLVWSSHPKEQAQLATTAISGALPRGKAASVGAGMYLNDGTSGKMAYYLDYVGGVRSVSCSSDGVQRFQARLRMRSKAPIDPSGLNSTIVGLGRHVAIGSMIDRLFVYGPSGGRVVGLEANGHALRLLRFRDGNRPVVFQNVVMKPHGHLDIVATYETAPKSTAGPTFEWTPGMHSGPTRISSASTCS